MALATFAKSRMESFPEVESAGAEVWLSPSPHPGPHSQFALQQHAFAGTRSSTRWQGVGELAAHGPARIIDIARAAIIPTRSVWSAADMTSLVYVKFQLCVYERSRIANNSHTISYYAIAVP